MTSAKDVAEFVGTQNTTRRVRSFTTSATLLLILATTAVGWSADITPPALERFSKKTTESPDFQRHVIPLLGRLGCNGRACHGSFQGKGGFRLSLFGYDFAMDHRELTTKVGDEGEVRINKTDAHDSLILLKPTHKLDHEGGKRFDRFGWQYNVLARWIEAGAKINKPQRLDRLEVSPSEIVFQAKDERATVRVIAHWSDGSTEDVTCLCRFRSNDDTIADINPDGQVTAKGKGDTHLIVFYDNGVANVPVMMPVSTDDYPVINTKTNIDRLVVEKLSKLGVVPSDVCNDADFLRRVSIDMTGTLPTPDEIEAFFADTSADKRAKKIDQLLDSPAYAAWWANKLCDFTGNSRFRQSEGRIGDVLAEQWYGWIYRRVADNMSYDKLIEGIVLATGRSDGQSYEDYAAEMSSYLRNTNEFAKRESMPHFWTRRTVEKPEDKALAFAHSFLGLRLQCAQCHKHPFDQWTQQDFKQFTSFFAGVRYGIQPDATAIAQQLAKSAGQKTNGKYPFEVTQEAAAKAIDGLSIAWRELFHQGSPTGKLNLLGQQVEVAAGDDPRRAIMDWLRERDNAYFARAFVNRVWANYFHAGLIEPVDDLSLANPPSNRALLDYLAGKFVARRYDMKWLHREITTSDTYQRTWRPNETNRDDRRNFSRAIPRRLHAEVIYDALKQVTAPDSQLVAVRENLDRRAIGHLATRMAGTYAQKVFGQPDRIIACDCERRNDPTLLQSIFMQNDPLIQVHLSDSGWLKEIDTQVTAKDADIDINEIIRAAYLRTFSRPPTAAETERSKKYIEQSDSVTDGMRDILWALINSKEFLLNH